MSAILTKMTECLEFMKRQGAEPVAIEVMEEAIMHQQLTEEVIQIEREGPGGQGKD